MEWAIEAHDVVKDFGRVRALDHVSLQIRRGEVFGFLGPNGAGKTTFVKILLNLIFPDRGYAKIFGDETRSTASRKKTGFLPENISPYSFLTVKEFLQFQLKLAGIAYKRNLPVIDENLRRLNIYEYRNKKIGVLSKGVKQRVGIAQALLNEPELLLMDEPTSGLDPIGIRELREILLEMKREGTTIFLSSHLLSEIERTCDSVAIIDKGKIIKMGNTNDLSNKKRYLEITGEGFTELLYSKLQALFRYIEVGDQGIKVYLTREDDALAVHQIIAQHGGKVHSLIWKSETLEDIFCRLVKREVL
ncbi:MAG: ABC transporter ATP-binding protein [Proteobacteria bacterium]|nr:ABC transporter ATP-binding protein [Pseudomonadota bacterium]